MVDQFGNENIVYPRNYTIIHTVYPSRPGHTGILMNHFYLILFLSLNNVIIAIKRW